MGCKSRGNPGIFIDDLIINLGCGTVKQLEELYIRLKIMQKYVIIYKG